jgi:flavin-binding protein dodecin
MKNTKIIEVFGRSEDAWDEATKQIKSLIAEGYVQTNVTTSGAKTTLFFRPSAALQGAMDAVERAADEFADVYLTAVSLTSDHLNITPDVAAQMIRIGGKIHAQWQDESD